jgi:hypothetical protein
MRSKLTFLPRWRSRKQGSRPNQAIYSFFLRHARAGLARHQTSDGAVYFEEGFAPSDVTGVCVVDR